MIYKRYNDIYLVRMDAGEEVLECLSVLAAQENIRLAEVSAIGATDHAVVGVYDLETQEYCREELDGFMEITNLSGNISTMNGKPYIHLHVTMADRNHDLHGGHVNELRIGATCEMFVRAIDGEIDRERDEKLGIKLWRF